MAQNVIAVKNLSHHFSNVEVLTDITFSIAPGDYVSIIGPNGSGKTTLLKLILGVYKKQAGDITLFGRELQDFRDWDRVGYVPQKATHFDPLFPATVQEVVAMGLLARKRLPKVITKADGKHIADALRLVDMLEFKDRRIGDLSGGQQQRVFIARAVIATPDILFLDEPVSGVDAATQQKFYSILRDLNKKKKTTIVFVTHDVASISQDISKILYINQHLQYFGPADNFCRAEGVSPEFAEAQHMVCHVTHQGEHARHEHTEKNA